MLYFYFGSNTYLIEEKLRAFKERYVAKYPSALNFHLLDIAEAEIRTVRGLVEAQSLFSDTTLIFMEGLAEVSAQRSEELVEVFTEARADKREDVVVVFFARKEKKQIIGGNKLFAYLAKHAHMQEFAPLTGTRLLDWVRGYVSEQGGGIDASVAAALIGRRGEDMLLLSHELEKLIAYSGGETITHEMVELLVPQAVSVDVFATIHALGQRKVARAIDLLHTHRDVGDDPFQLLGMFAYEVRTLLYIKDAMSRGEEASLRSTYGIHPFVIQKNRVLADAFSLDKLILLHATLARADFLAKTGEKDPYEALEDVALAFSPSHKNSLHSHS